MLSDIIKKYKLQLTVILLLAGLIAFSAAASGIHRGHRKTASNVSEQFSAVSENRSETVQNMIEAAGIENLSLPKIYSTTSPKIVSVKTETCKRYTQCTVVTTTGTIEVKAYNYANIIEDEQMKIPEGAEKINRANTDIFCFKNTDNTSTALYYDDLKRYTITENCSIPELKELFNALNNENK